DKPGTYMFKWTVSNKNCFKSDTVTMVSHQPAMIDGLGGADSNFCGPLLSLTPLSPMIEFPNARGRWSGTVRGPSGTQPSLASKSGNTYNFKGFSLPGTYTLEWIVQNTYNTLVCTETQKINVVNNQPTIIGLGESANVCGSSGQISPTIAADFEFPTAIGRWQFIPQANRSPIYDPTSFALDISKLGKAGIYNFVWTVKNLGCSLSDTIKIINDQPSIIDALLANDENDTSYCRSDFIMVANNPKDEDPNFIGQWTKTPGAGEVSNRTSPKALTSLVNGENIYVWQINNQANSLCKTIYDSVTIRKEPANYGIVIENGLTEVHVCKDTITLDLQLNKNFNPDVINWNTKGSSTGAIIINRNAVSPFVINLSYGKNIFEVEVMKGICSDIGFITIVRDSLPSNVAITTPLDGSFICAESILLTAPDPNKQISSAKGEWTVISHNQSHFSNSDLSLPTATLSELQRGNTYSAIWSVSNGMCGPITETVNFTVQEEINLPDQDIDTVLCGKNSFEISLSDQGPGAVLYGWEQSYGNPIVFKDKLSPKTTIQNIKEGQYVFIWKVESESCKDSVILNIISKPIVSKAFAGRDTILCSSLDFPLQPNQPLIGTGRWTRVAGTAPIQPEPASQTIPLSNGKNTFVWKISKDGHCSTVDTIEIINYIPPIPANAGLDITTYADQYTLTASDPSPGKGYLTSLNHSPLLRKLNDEQTEIFNLADGENKFTWTVQNGTCPSTTDTISIIKETFIIPNAFSPNNDLTNDFFEIKGLHQFGQADLIVFNRIGEEVYSNSNYNNSWDGKDKSGNRLDDDTYYFILKIKNKAPIKNFVVLKR
ncbi:MAG TPA: gliding motility-associated C-terminal domain-containing protein, partial [Cytophagaceae bacterium]